MRRQGGTRHAIKHRDIVSVGRPAEMRQRQRPQLLEIERGRQLVIGETQLFAAHRQRMLKAGEDEHGIRPALADDGPGLLELAKVVLGRREDLATRIGQVRRMRMAKAIGCHAGPSTPQ